MAAGAPTDKTMKTRNEQLRELMKRHRLTVEDVSRLIGRSPQTVRVWRCKYPQREIPEHTLELLQMKVAAL